MRLLPALLLALLLAPVASSDCRPVAYKPTGRAVIADVGAGIGPLTATSPLDESCTAPAMNLCENGYTWKRIKLCGGGFVSGIDIAADAGTIVVRADVYGAYLLGGDGEWDQLVLDTTMPPEDVHPEKATGVFEIVSAPNDTDRLYMSFYGYVYRSDDRGANWTKTAFVRVSMEANDNYRRWGEKIVTDPDDADVVFVGTGEDGLWKSADAGATWAQTSLPVSTTSRGITGLTHSGTELWAASSGNGVYKSTNEGTSWTQMSDGAGLGGPTVVRHGAREGTTYFYTDEDYVVWRYDGSWTDITPGAPTEFWRTVTVDPKTASRIAAMSTGGGLRVSRDSGDNWDASIVTMNRVATDCPWLLGSSPLATNVGLNPAEILFDPVTTGKIWITDGAGVWTGQITAGVQTTITFTSQTEGIDELIPREIAVPATGKPVIAMWDFPLFNIIDPDVAYSPPIYGPIGTFLTMASSVKTSADDPAFLVSTVSTLLNAADQNQSASSINNGADWVKFPSTPTGTLLSNEFGFGTIAAATTDDWVWISTVDKQPQYTNDAGVTWDTIDLGGAVAWGNMHWGYHLNRHTVTADTVNIGTYYLYWAPWPTPDPSIGHGIWKSTDSGANWSLVKDDAILAFTNYSAKLKAVPGKADHLFFTAGGQGGAAQQGDPPFGAFAHTTDGGLNWSLIPNIEEVLSFGFGKAIGAGTYPAIYIAGYLNDVYGIYRSDDEGATWVMLEDYPFGVYVPVVAISGDMAVEGRVYAGLSGNGAAWGGCIP